LDLENKVTVFSSPIFQVEELTIKSKQNSLPKPRYRITCQDWANILPITREGKAILIRQPRFGSLESVLETPGGLIDKEDRDPMFAALRELEEETGYTSQRILPLGAFNPNPAIMSNTVHFFLAIDCFIATERKHFQDPDEDIEIVQIQINELDMLVRTCRINHALSALCIQLALNKFLVPPSK